MTRANHGAPHARNCSHRGSALGLPIAVTYSSPGPWGGIALHEVHISRNPEDAAEEYEDAISFWFSDDDRHTPWITPTELAYRRNNCIDGSGANANEKSCLRGSAAWADCGSDWLHSLLP